MKKALGLLVLAAACHRAPDTSMVDSAVELFHQRLASGDDDAIYRDAGIEYQRSIDVEMNHKFLAQIRRGRGSPGRATRTDYAVTGAVVNAVYKVSFANGDATETFVWRVTGGKAVLLGFTIN
jgi:hypothetical protein